MGGGCASSSLEEEDEVSRNGGGGVGTRPALIWQNRKKLVDLAGGLGDTDLPQLTRELLDRSSGRLLCRRLDVQRISALRACSWSPEAAELGTRT